MAGKTDISKLLEKLEHLCLEYRAWKYIALNYTPHEKPLQLFADYCKTPARRLQAAALLDDSIVALQQNPPTTEACAALLRAIEEIEEVAQ